MDKRTIIETPVEVDSAPTQKKEYHVGIVDIKNLVKAEVQDATDRVMNDSLEERQGNWFQRKVKKIKEIWTHNLGEQIVRDGEIKRVRNEISESNNLYAGSTMQDGSTVDDSEAMIAIVDKFTNDEYEHALLSEAERDSKQTLEDENVANKLKDLIKEYATSTMTREELRQRKADILNETNNEALQKMTTFADNIYEIAESIKNNVHHNKMKALLDFDLKITLGETQDILNTKTHYNTAEKITEWAGRTPVGKVLGNEVVGSAVAYAATGAAFGQSLITSKIAKWTTFGVSGLVAGAIAGVREHLKVKKELTETGRAFAVGEQNSENSPRRIEMQQFIAETKPASAVIADLSEGARQMELYKEDISMERLQTICDNLADVEARIAVGDVRGVDVISYTNKGVMITEKNKIDITRATLRHLLDSHLPDSKVAYFQHYLEHAITRRAHTLDEDLEVKGKKFVDMKREKILWRAGMTATLGVAFGLLAQEAYAGVSNFFHKPSDHVTGVVEGIYHYFKGDPGTAFDSTQTTALEDLRRTLMGDHVPGGPMKMIDLGYGLSFNVPKDVDVVPNYDAQGTVNIYRGDDLIGENVSIEFDAYGNINADTQELLKEYGFASTTEFTHEEVTSTSTAEEYVSNHDMTKINYNDFYDNNTKAFDLNEQKLWWGGENASGVNANGNYEFNLKHMTPGGSFHDGVHLNAQQAALEGRLKMVFNFTEGTKNMVFELPVGPDMKVIITPENHDLYYNFFRVDAHGHAIYDGYSAVIAESHGVVDGVEQLTPLAKIDGMGIEQFVHQDIIDQRIVNLIPMNDFDAPIALPLITREPLEKTNESGEKKNEETNPDQEPEVIEKNERESPKDPITPVVIPVPVKEKTTEQAPINPEKTNGRPYHDMLRLIEEKAEQQKRLQNNNDQIKLFKAQESLKRDLELASVALEEARSTLEDEFEKTKELKEEFQAIANEWTEMRNLLKDAEPHLSEDEKALYRELIAKQEAIGRIAEQKYRAQYAVLKRAEDLVNEKQNIVNTIKAEQAELAKDNKDKEITTEVPNANREHEAREDDLGEEEVDENNSEGEEAKNIQHEEGSLEQAIKLRKLEGEFVEKNSYNLKDLAKNIINFEYILSKRVGEEFSPAQNLESTLQMKLLKEQAIEITKNLRADTFEKLTNFYSTLLTVLSGIKSPKIMTIKDKPFYDSLAVLNKLVKKSASELRLSLPKDAIRKNESEMYTSFDGVLSNLNKIDYQTDRINTIIVRDGLILPKQ